MFWKQADFINCQHIDKINDTDALRYKRNSDRIDKLYMAV